VTQLKKIQIPSEPEAMAEFLGEMSDEQLQQLLELNKQYEDDWAKTGPKNDDELHEWIRVNLNINIPRTACCIGHVAPFDFLADLYFGRVNAALGVGPRGGGKTFMIAVLHWLNARFKPGSWGLTFGAVEHQSYVAYNHLKMWIYDDEGNLKPEIVSSLQRETVFRNGSRVSVLGTTKEQVNGPHPQVAHADEIELMNPDTWSESRNMTIAKQLSNELLMLPQDVSTSTRKGPSGRVQELINEIDDAIKEGMEPPRKLYMWCQKETAREIPNCQKAPEEKRKARMEELLEKIGTEGLRNEYSIENPDPCATCNCDKIGKGFNEDGSRRTLADVCQGDFFRSRGFQPFADVRKAFTENPVETYEAQILCQKPEMKWHFLPTFAEEKHCIRDYIPDPGNGPIFTSTDWGGTDPHAVNWYQLLRYDIEATDFRGNPTVIRAGTLVCFDEIYKAEIGPDKLADEVKYREMKWKNACLEAGFTAPFRIFERYADPQGKMAILSWRDKKLPTTWHASREVEPQYNACRELVCDDDLFRVDVRNDMWVKEAKAWRRDEKTGKELDEGLNHAMANFRYMVINLTRIRSKAMGTDKRVPHAKQIGRKTRVIDTRKPQGPLSYKGNARNEYEEWRKSLGEPVTRVRNDNGY
jgi:hypothetical protein